jgi:hypothetical protein
MNTIIILGIICLFLSIAIYIFVGRRKFYRRNQSGIETFRSFTSSVLTPLGERILKLVSLYCSLLASCYLWSGILPINIRCNINF